MLVWIYGAHGKKATSRRIFLYFLYNILDIIQKRIRFLYNTKSLFIIQSQTIPSHKRFKMIFCSIIKIVFTFLFSLK